MKNNLSEWQRLSPVSVLVFFIKVIRFNWTAIPLVYVSLKDLELSFVSWVLVGVLLSLITCVIAYIRYLNFKFRCDETDVHIQSGVFSKTNQSISFDRIQTLKTEQNLIFKQFNLVKVELDTAGSSGSEVSLPVVAYSVYESLNDLIYTEANVVDVDKNESTRYTYSLKDYILTGLTSNRMFIVIAGIYGTYTAYSEQLSDLSGIQLENEVDVLSNKVSELSYEFLIVLGILFLFLFIAFSVLGAGLFFYKLDIRFKNEVIDKAQGFFSRSKNVLKSKKVQTITLSRNVFHKLLSGYKLVIKQASTTDDLSLNQQFLVPFLNPQLRDQIIAFLFPSVKLDDVHYKKIDRSYMFITNRNYVWLPSLICIGVSAYNQFLLWYASFAWLIIGTVVVYRKYLSYAYSINSDFVYKKSGVFGDKLTFAETFKVQSVQFKQSPYQRQKKLATLLVSFASETLIIPYISLQEATEYSEFILNEVTSTQKKWF